MKSRPVKVTRYGTEVWESVEMEALRKTDCLCQNCEGLRHAAGPQCEKAIQIIALCKAANMALATTRCPAWRPYVAAKAGAKVQA
jgi:hypothetical protein